MDHRSKSFKAGIFCLLLALLFLGSPAIAQTKSEDLPKKEIKLEKEYWRTPVKSQGRTGTCWSFSSISFFESEVYRMGNGEFELSEMFNSRQCYVDKADRYIRGQGTNNFGPGGLFHDMLWVLRNHGAATDEAFPGVWPGEETLDHREIHNVLAGYLDGVLKGRAPSQKWKKGFKAILDVYFGKLPEKISHDGKEMTTLEFAKDVLRINPDDYIEFTSFTYLPFYTKVELIFPDNWAHYDCYVNVPLEEFIAIMDYALENGFTVGIGGDVSEKTFSQSKWGYGIVEADNEDRLVTQAEREKMFDDWSSSDDHAMHTVGYGSDENGKRFYYTKNSWGTDEDAPYNGYCYFSVNYIRAKMHSILVHKDAVPAGIMAKIQ